MIIFIIIFIIIIIIIIIIITIIIIKYIYRSGARFSKGPESFRAREATFRSSVSKNGEVYTHETCCMKGTSSHL